jgi:hypothetical protein
MIYNWTLSFQGDSITSQTFQGYECELRRRGYTVIRTNEPYNVTNPDPNRWNYGIQDITRLDISFPVSADDNNTNTNFMINAKAIIRYYRMYRPIEDNVEIQKVVIPNTDILVFDHGLHYDPDTNNDFRNMMNKLLPTFMDGQRDKKLQLVAWRQTSAQHYNAPGGHYYSLRNPNRTYCVPMDPKNDTEGYRVFMVQQVAIENNISFLNPLELVS